MPEAFATPEGTARYAKRLSGQVAPSHFRESHGLQFSSIGLGTYLGEDSDEDDAGYASAVVAALRLGANVIDTAINYRCQRSERAIGQALLALFREGVLARDEVIVATKGGFLPFDGRPPGDREALLQYVRETFLDPGIIAPQDLVGGMHCLSPSYLRHQISRSLANLGLESIDVYFLHNPEEQLSRVSREEFVRRIRAAFETLEEAVSRRRIRLYGTATRNGYRQRPDARDYLSLYELTRLAQEVAGDGHHFRVVQLPYNLAMYEAFTLANQRIPTDGQDLWYPILEAARRLDITVLCSASILQGKLARGLPPELEDAFPGLGSDVQRAIQFVRSTPGVTTALVGMKNATHVEENLKLAAAPPASFEDFLKLFQQASA